MIDIKFRAWYYIEKKMYYNVIVFDGGVCKKLSYDKWEPFYDEDGPLEDTAVIPMQYTGINDFIGNEIYDGDLLVLHSDRSLDKPRIWVVKWKHGSWVCKTKAFTSNNLIALYSMKSMSGDYDIIGNIYENGILY